MINWEEIKNIYIHGENTETGIVYYSISQLAEKFHISKSNLSVKIKKEQWEISNQLYRQNIVKKVKELKERNRENERTERTKAKENERIRINEQNEQAEQKNEEQQVDKIAKYITDTDMKCIDLTDQIFTIATQSLKTIRRQVKELRAKDPFIIAPADEIKKITDYIKNAQFISRTAIGENPEKPNNNFNFNFKNMNQKDIEDELARLERINK